MEAFLEQVAAAARKASDQGYGTQGRPPVQGKSGAGCAPEKKCRPAPFAVRAGKKQGEKRQRRTEHSHTEGIESVRLHLTVPFGNCYCISPPRRTRPSALLPSTARLHGGAVRGKLGTVVP